jgi:dipeptidyl aminopeptidase/acylaminoacyl peptidase
MRRHFLMTQFRIPWSAGRAGRHLLFAGVIGAQLAGICARAADAAVDTVNVPPVPADLEERVHAFLCGREARLLGWSPQGALLIATRFGETEQLHLVRTPGGERRQLTFFRDPVRVAAFSPDPQHGALAFLRDVDGDENLQLFLMRAEDPAPRLLTDGKSQNLAPVWSNTGRALAFSTTARDGKSLDIDLVEPNSGALPRLLVASDGAAWTPLDWSPDDSELLVLKEVSSRESHLYLVDVDSGKKRELDAGSTVARSVGAAPKRKAAAATALAAASISAARFARDGQGAYVITDRDAEFRQLWFVNFFTNQRTLVSGHHAGDVKRVAISRDGHYLAYVVEDGDADRIELVDLNSHQDLTPPHLPAPGIVDALAFDPAGGRLAFDLAATASPRDAYVLDVATNRLEAWTESEAGTVDVSKFTVPRDALVPSFDRDGERAREIPTSVYEPAGPAAHPVVILLRGAAHAEFRPSFDPQIQFLAGEGYAVIAPKLRGAAGFGKSYAALGMGRAREDAIKDLGAVIVWIRAQSGLDSNRVVVAGADSYGGFLALAALAYYGDRLRGAIDAGGIADFVSLLADSSGYRQDRLRQEFGDERDADVRQYLRRIAPATNAERLVKPLFIAHGRHDGVVPASQSEQLFDRLRARDPAPWYWVATGDGSVLTRQSDREAYLGAVALFLDSLR